MIDKKLYKNTILTSNVSRYKIGQNLEIITGWGAKTEKVIITGLNYDENYIFYKLVWYERFFPTFSRLINSIVKRLRQ